MNDNMLTIKKKNNHVLLDFWMKNLSYDTCVCFKHDVHGLHVPFLHNRWKEVPPYIVICEILFMQLF